MANGTLALVQVMQELAGARQRDDAIRAPQVGLGVQPGQPRQRLAVEPLAGLPLQRVQEEPAAHADAPVDPPDRQRDAALGERLLPGDDVLVHRVDERAVEVEEQGGLRDVHAQGFDAVGHVCPSPSAVGCHDQSVRSWVSATTRPRLMTQRGAA